MAMIIELFKFQMMFPYNVGQFAYHRQQNKCYPKGVRLSEKLQLTSEL